MLVIATGMNSEWGKTLSKLQEEPEQTPLQKKLDNLANNIGKVGTTVAVLVFMILTIWWLAVDVANKPWAWVKLRNIVYNFIVGVTIVVVSVPEGIPVPLMQFGGPPLNYHLSFLQVFLWPLRFHWHTR